MNYYLIQDLYNEEVRINSLNLFMFKVIKLRVQIYFEKYSKI